MWLSREERAVLAALGVIGLVGFGVLAWQRQRPMLTLEAAPAPAQAATWNAALAHARQVDVNTAGSAELERLPGIGPALAARILAYRQAHGPFASIEELAHVQGIGPKTLERLGEDLTVR